MSIDSYMHRKLAVKIIKIFKGRKVELCFCSLNCKLLDDFSCVIFDNINLISCLECKKKIKDKCIKNVLLNNLKIIDYESFLKENECEHTLLKGAAYYYAFNYLRLSNDFDIYLNTSQKIKGNELKQKSKYSKLVAKTYICEKYKTEIDVHERLFYPHLIDEVCILNELNKVKQKNILTVENQKIYLMLNILRDGECSLTRYLDYKFISLKVNDNKLKKTVEELKVSSLEKVIRRIICKSLKNRSLKISKVEKLLSFIRVFGIIKVINHIIRR